MRPHHPAGKTPLPGTTPEPLPWWTSGTFGVGLAVAAAVVVITGTTALADPTAAWNADSASVAVEPPSQVQAPVRPVAATAAVPSATASAPAPGPTSAPSPGSRPSGSAAPEPAQIERGTVIRRAPKVRAAPPQPLVVPLPPAPVAPAPAPLAAPVAPDPAPLLSESLGQVFRSAVFETWVKPVSGYRRTAEFGDSGSRWSRDHTGLDLAAPTGTPVVAVAAGTVTSAGSAGAYGQRIVLTHLDGTETWYCHLSEIAVSEGSAVGQGARIGAVGSTGNSTGPHLHLEVRPGGGDPVDPVTALLSHGVRI